MLAADDTMEAGGIELNKAAHEVLIDGKSVELSYKEFELLNYFLQNRGVALSKRKNPELMSGTTIILETPGQSIPM